MQRVWKIVGMLVLWALVVGFVVVFSSRSRQHRAVTQVRALNVDIIDSLPDESLMSRELVERWIAQSGLQTVGTLLDKVDLVGIERAIRSNGFVDRASASVTYDGLLHIEVSQHKPLMRLVCGDYDCYVTREGLVFPSPGRSAVYVPVVSGSYIPPVPKDYVGHMEEYVRAKGEETAARILELQHEKKPFFDRDKEIDDSVREVRRMRVVKRGIIRYRGWGESEEAFDKRVAAKRREKNALYRRYRYWRKMNDRNIAAVTARQDIERDKQKKLEKRYEDFLKLINFVDYIENDSFWRAEIVQIVASTMSSGELELELIPRTGSYVVEFGKLGDEAQVEQKLDKLLAFYQNGLTKLGWSSFSKISIKYDGQVVCSKR